MSGIVMVIVRSSLFILIAIGRTLHVWKDWSLDRRMGTSLVLSRGKEEEVEQMQMVCRCGGRQISDRISKYLFSTILVLGDMTVNKIDRSLLTKSLHRLCYNKLVYVRKDKQMKKTISNSVKCLKNIKQDGWWWQKEETHFPQRSQRRPLWRGDIWTKIWMKTKSHPKVFWKGLDGEKSLLYSRTGQKASIL